MTKKDVWDPTRKDMQISTKLVLITGFAIVFCCIAVAALSLGVFNSEFVKSLESSLDFTTNGVNFTLNDWRTTAEADAKTLADIQDLRDLIIFDDSDALHDFVSSKGEDLGIDFLAVADIKGNVFSGGGYNLPNGTNLAMNSAVQSAIRGTTSYAIEPFGTSKMSLVGAAPIYDSGVVIGIMCAAYNLESGDFVASVNSNFDVECTVFKGATRVSTTVFDSNGNSMVGTSISDLSIVEKVQGQRETFRGRTTIGGIPYLARYFPISSGNGSVTGMLFIAKSMKSVNSVRYNAIKIIIPCVIFLCIILMIIVGFFIRWLMWRINNVTKVLKDMETGEADLTKRVKLLIRDEIGMLVIHFDKFCDKLQSIVKEIKNSKGTLDTAGEQLSYSTEDTANAITEIIANIDSVHSQIAGQGDSVSQVASIVDQISSSIDQLDSMIESQSAGISQASTAVEEMIGNISSVNTSVDKMAHSFSDLASNAQTGFSKQQDVNERIKQIEVQSEMLQEANQAISSIAEQTNLLAMNAAIEAAHAGETGKGFSVVADEIRKLSETSAAQSKTIGDQLNNIKNSITEVVAASNESSEAFSAVSNKIKETDELVMQIKAAMEEQNSGSKQIGDALRNMNESTSQVRKASKEMSGNSQVILKEMHTLQDSTDVMKQSMSEMSTGARKINETGAALADISSQVKNSINQIGSQIDLFTV